MFQVNRPPPLSSPAGAACRRNQHRWPTSGHRLEGEGGCEGGHGGGHDGDHAGGHDGDLECGHGDDHGDHD